MRVKLVCMLAAIAVPLSVEAAPAVPPAALSAASQVADFKFWTGGPARRRPAWRDCRPFNGPYGYHGNPWCERGWKYTEDRFDSSAYWYAPRLRYRHWRR